VVHSVEDNKIYENHFDQDDQTDYLEKISYANERFHPTKNLRNKFNQLIFTSFLPVCEQRKAISRSGNSTRFVCSFTNGTTTGGGLIGVGAFIDSDTLCRDCLRLSPECSPVCDRLFILPIGFDKE
jgi:hypothetical protein